MQLIRQTFQLAGDDYRSDVSTFVSLLLQNALEWQSEADFSDITY